MRFLKPLYLFLVLFTFSCSDKNDSVSPVLPPEAITKDMLSFLTYRENNVHLYKPYKALDSASHPISNEAFLKQLASGSYLPLRLQTPDSTLCYQLHPLGSGVDPQISETIKYWAGDEYAYAQAEGKSLPDFEFVDMEGVRYTKENTKGKILVLKCWFLACLPCKQEMPHLNEIKKQYSDRKDILFVSVCLDEKRKVADFLETTAFTYATVPGQEQYLQDELKLTAYPTHFIVNKQGNIVKKVNDYRAMAYVLSKEALN